jgi:hypothetical protein
MEMGLITGMKKLCPQNHYYELEDYYHLGQDFWTT